MTLNGRNTRKMITATFRNGDVLEMGLTARFTRSALITASSAYGSKITPYLTQAELESEWKYKNGVLNFGNGACIVTFGDTERTILAMQGKLA